MPPPNVEDNVDLADGMPSHFDEEPLLDAVDEADHHSFHVLYVQG